MKTKYSLWLVIIVVVFVLGFVTTPTADAQGGIIWNTEIFDNPYLLQPAAVTRQDTRIAFDWNVNAPVPQVHADNFTIRWGTDAPFSEGVYRFSVLADDNVRVWVDFQPLIDTFSQPRVGQIVSADLPLTAGTHHIQVDYRENTGNAYIFFDWANLEVFPQGPVLPVPEQMGQLVPLNVGVWTAQYYNNATLTGMPTVVRAETTPSHNWGDRAPFNNLNNDNFSVRWTGLMFLNAGTYRIDVRADDGIRVFVNGQLLIDEWHPASGETYTAEVALPTGAHNFMVEYYELGGDAFVDYRLMQMSTRAPTPAPVTGPRAIVMVERLNVRNTPDIETGVILRTVNQGEVYPVIGRTSDSSWWQINTGDVIGWVFGALVNTRDVMNVPVTSGVSVGQPVTSGVEVVALNDVNIRRGPGIEFDSFAILPEGEMAQVVGRNTTLDWWQIRYNNRIGWVFGSFVSLEGGADLSRIPVTG
ncbi:MAG: hypothetical protein D6737_08720 [Chloroflexi bacterium]|nr:MAG: hypothetical protein D6737_08720 [Chloroflexota bacterium]